MEFEEEIEAETLANFARNEELFDSITSSRPVYDTAIICWRGGDSEVNPLTMRKDFKTFVSEEASIVFEAGSFAVVDGGLASGEQSSDIVEDEEKELAQIKEYVEDRENEAAAIELFHKISTIAKSLPGYVLVSYGVENDMSYLAIHKEDYETLQKFIPLGMDAEYWLWDTEGGKRIQDWNG